MHDRIGDLAKVVAEISDAEVVRVIAEYEANYVLPASLLSGGQQRASLDYAARTELGLRHFLESGGFKAFTDTFEDLHGLTQVPGLAVQRLMADGYGFVADGDWKTAALGRAMKGMAQGFGAPILKRNAQQTQSRHRLLGGDDAAKRPMLIAVKRLVSAA